MPETDPAPTAPAPPSKADAGHPAPAPKGPVLDPPRKARHPYYIAHMTFHLANGDRFNRGDVLSGKDALAFELAIDTGETNVNFATPTPHDKNPGA
jgi:hypothetical protein